MHTCATDGWMNRYYVQVVQLPVSEPNKVKNNLWPGYPGYQLNYKMQVAKGCRSIDGEDLSVAGISSGSVSHLGCSLFPCMLLSPHGPRHGH